MCSDLIFFRSVKLVLLLITGFHCYAQTPAHFYIGETEFSNSNVYSLLHHSDGYLYAATNYGLHKYQNGRFQAIDWVGKHEGDALFSLRNDSKGNLYCSNLAGEIFKLTDRGLQLWLKTPDKFLTSYFDFGFDDEDRIFICAKSYLLYENSSWIEIYQTEKATPASLNPFNPEQLLFPSMESEEIFAWDNGSLQSLSGQSHQQIKHTDIFRYCVAFGEFNFSISTSGSIFNASPNEIGLTGETNLRFYQIDNNELWVGSNSAGVYMCTEENNHIEFTQKMFPETFISAITKSENGTIFLGTFGNGVIVIPNSTSMVFSSSNEELEGVLLCSGNNDVESFIAGYPNAQSYSSEGETLLASSNPIFHVAGVNFGLSLEHPGILYTTTDQTIDASRFGNIKDVQRINDSCAIVATSLGLFRVGSFDSQDDWVSDKYGPYWTRRKGPFFRCGSVGYCYSTGEIYYSKQGRLIRIMSNGKEQECIYNGQAIRCTDVLSFDSHVIVATPENGLLYLKEGEVINQINSNHGLNSNAIRKIELKGDQLFVAHRNGFQIYNVRTKQWITFGNKLGIQSNAVTNFVVQKEHLWLICHGDLVRIPLSSIDSNPDFEFQLGPILLGNHKYSSKTASVPYNVASIKIPLSFKGIEFEKDTWIEYRLNKGEWKKIPATSDKIEYTDLASGNYLVEIRVNYQGQISHEEHIKFTVEPPFWQTFWFLSITVFLTLLTGYWYFQRRIKKLKKSQQEKINTQQLITDKLESELKALRSQMNPHFIFNSLNSIQDLILREETDNSYDYIVLFAKLVRNTLNYSNLDFIPIDKEIEFLEIYLSLEKLRFENDFDYSIVNLNAEGIELPSLLIQPFVENALEHGLMHKRGAKEVSIRFELNDELKCIVQDNGIGRIRSKEIQRRQQGGHKSFAMEAIRQRLDLLNKQFGESVGKYEVIDIYQDGEQSGTRIEIIIPHRKLY